MWLTLQGPLKWRTRLPAEEGSEEAGWGVAAVRGGAQPIAAACVAGAGSQVCARGCD